MIDSLGFIEVYGFVAGVHASDAMLKSANVRILNYEMIVPGIVAIVVEGDLAACRAAVDAGVAAVQKNGCQLLGRHVIGRPDADTEIIVMGLSGSIKIAASNCNNNSKEPISADASVEKNKVEEIPEKLNNDEIPKSMLHDEILNIIKKSEHHHGATVAEVSFYFTNSPADIRSILDLLVKQKKLRKRASRYGLA